MIEQERMVRLELKYCERCGGLLLRRRGEAVVYCGPCSRSLAEMPEMKVVGRAKKAQVSLIDHAYQAKAGAAKVEAGTPKAKTRALKTDGETKALIGVPKKRPQSVGIEAAEARRVR